MTHTGKMNHGLDVSKGKQALEQIQRVRGPGQKGKPYCVNEG